MPPIPTNQPDVYPLTTVDQPRMRDAGQGREFSTIGEGLDNLGRVLEHSGDRQMAHEQHLKELAMHQQNVIGHLEQTKLTQVKTLEVNQMYSQLRTDWNKRLIEYQDNPGDPNLLKTATGEYDKYVEGMLQNSRWDDTKKELALHAASYKLDLTNELYRLQSHQQLQEFGATYDKMLSNADDSIFMTKSMGEMQAQKQLLNKTIDDAVNTGQIKDKTTIQNLRDKANLLGVSWAESVLPINPEAVKTAIDGGYLEGVSASHKYILLQKADEVIKTKGAQEKLLLHDALQSDITQRTMTGEGNSADLDRIEAVFGKSYRDKAARELGDATLMHSVVELAHGASNARLASLLDKFTPTADPESPLYKEQMEFHSKVQQYVNLALTDRKNDAFTYFAQNPVVKPIAERAAQSPDNKGMQQALQEAVLEQQRMDPTIMPYEYAVMPKADAQKFAENFNKLVAVGTKGDGMGVRDQLLQFMDQYGAHLPIAVNQLNTIKHGDKITPEINPLLWHVNNPSVFRLIVDSIRKNPTEELKRLGEEKEIKNFLATAHTDKNLMLYTASVLAANNGEEASRLVRGVKETFTDFSRDYVANGGKLKDASNLFFGPYSFGKHNGAVFARPNEIADSLGKPHVLTDRDTANSNQYLDWYLETAGRNLRGSSPLALDSIDPKTIVNETAHFTEDQLRKDVSDALSSNAFWSTTEDETGVYLYTKGTLFGAPRQVLNKSGKPVRVNFVDTLNGAPFPEPRAEGAHRGSL